IHRAAETDPDSDDLVTADVVLIQERLRSDQNFAPDSRRPLTRIDFGAPQSVEVRSFATPQRQLQLRAADLDAEAEFHVGWFPGERPPSPPTAEMRIAKARLELIRKPGWRLEKHLNSP